jgi:DNA repair photolyase
MSKHQKVTIKRDNGETVQGIAPIIITASRSTDIPGLYGDWFVNRLQKGYVAWRNPFNGQFQYISFEKTRCIVFWTKNPAPFLKHIKTIERMGIGVLFQVTVNDYEIEKLEMNLPPLQTRISAVVELSQYIGKEKVLWRFDPLILTEEITIGELLKKIERVGDELYRHVGRLTISFLSPYKKVVRNLKSFGVHEITQQDKLMIASGISDLNTSWKLPLFTCAETVDLSKYGIYHGSCVDAVLIANCFHPDSLLKDFLKISITTDLFGNETKKTGAEKDSGQRKECGCCLSKDIGMYNTCSHGCLYCYASASPIKAMHSRLLNSDGEFINVN